MQTDLKKINNTQIIKVFSIQILGWSDCGEFEVKI